MTAVQHTPGSLPDPLGCKACAHPECARFDGPHRVECRAMADNGCAREYSPVIFERRIAPVSKQELEALDRVRSVSAKHATAPRLVAVFDELERAMRKFPTWPTDPLHALAVLGEEYGELTKAVLQVTYEPNKATAADVREEAIQTAAMALRLLASLDEYVYQPSAQHTQDASVIVEVASQTGGVA